MINRELIRAKALQLLYAYTVNGNTNADNAEKEILFSLTKSYHLYGVMLELIVAITSMARKHGEVRFANNKFARQLADNKQLLEFQEKTLDAWKERTEIVKKLFDLMRESETYQEFVNSDDDSYEASKEVWRKLYKHFLADNKALEDLLEGDSLYWNGTKDIVDAFVMKTIRDFQEEKGAEQQLHAEELDKDDKEFACQLIRSAVMNKADYTRDIVLMSDNWRDARLVTMDKTIMQLALAEMFHLPSIPLRVTINEYVDLAKQYSTPKSGKYVNGMLDALVRKFIEEGKLLKAL